MCLSGPDSTTDGAACGGRAALSAGRAEAARRARGGRGGCAHTCVVWVHACVCVREYVRACVRVPPAHPLPLLRSLPVHTTLCYARPALRCITSGVLDGLRRLLSSEGLAGLYRGLRVKLYQTVLAAALLMALKEQVHGRTAALLLNKTKKSLVSSAAY